MICPNIGDVPVKNAIFPLKIQWLRKKIIKQLFPITYFLIPFRTRNYNAETIQKVLQHPVYDHQKTSAGEHYNFNAKNAPVINLIIA